MALTGLFSLAWMMSRASSPSAFLPHISTLTRFFVTFFSAFLSYKSLTYPPRSSECRFFMMAFLILLEYTVAFFVLLKLLIVLSCAWQKNVPNNAQVLILRTCDHVILYGKRNFADAIDLRILKWKNYPRLFKWAPCNCKGPYKREAGGWKGENML